MVTTREARPTRVSKPLEGTPDYFKYAGMVLAGLIVVFPFLWMIVLSFKTDVEIFSQPLALPAVWDPKNYKIAFEKIDFLLFAKNTFIMAIGAVSLEVIFHFMSSFAITRLRFKNRRMQEFFRIFFVVGLLIPVFVLLYPIYLMSARMGILNTHFAVFLPYVGGAASFNSMLLIGAMRSFPCELEDAAVIDGCSLWQLMVRIEMPTLFPVLATLIIWNFLGVWNEYPIAVIMINKEGMRTLSLAASLFKSQYNTSYAGLTAGLVVLMVPQLLFYAFFQKYIVAGMMAGAIKG
jgi:raffinose/stachyose/melibiose transport system permease protein